MPMQRKTTIMILPNGERDWIVREDGGRELGHYPTRKEAEAVNSRINAVSSSFSRIPGARPRRSDGGVGSRDCWAGERRTLGGKKSRRHSRRL